MPELVIRVPAAHFSEVAKAVASTYGNSPTLGGLKEHIIAHLRQTVIDYKQQQAMVASKVDFDITWDDLEFLTPRNSIPNPTTPQAEGEAEALRQSRPDDQT